MRKPREADPEEAKKAAIEVLLNNARGPFKGLPRTAGWGYPEPYTRDLMISSLGMLLTGNERLVRAVGRTLETLARNQTRLGHITSLAHDPTDRGASDTTPLFLIGTALYRKTTAQPSFLEEAVQKALVWMEYQSPSDRVIVAQQPTSDWRDEQWVYGFGLYVNCLLHMALKMHGRHDRADFLADTMHRLDIHGGRGRRTRYSPLAVAQKPHYSLYVYKHARSDRLDLLGNCLAVLSGIASPSRAEDLISWIEGACRNMRKSGELAVNLPPALFPFIQPTDADWLPRYSTFGRPGEYHNGGVWPFICGFYIAATVATGRLALARRKFKELTRLVRIAANPGLRFGFNEWFRAQDGAVRGQDWQTWSAAMYLYAAACVEEGRTPFLDELRAERPGKNKPGV